MEEYMLLSLCKLNSAARHKFVYVNSVTKIRDKINNVEYINYFLHKHLFNKTFCGYIGRSWVYAPDHTDEEIIDFIKKTRIVLVKPVDQLKGRGIFKVDYNLIDNHEHFCCEAKKNKYLIEEIIIQHPDLSAVNPNSVNTLRINTILCKTGELYFINAVFRCAVNDAVIDNFAQGGIVTSVDLETGLLRSNSIDIKGQRYMRHPLTNIVLPGFQIPMWDQTLDLLREAAKVIPQIRLVGWDVAITEEGPVLVEGNHESGPRLMQHEGVGIRRLLTEQV